MNRRITKTMAYQAAIEIKKSVYSEKIENVYNKLNAEGNKLVKKYIPAPVLACVSEFSDYFSYIMGASISTTKEYPNGRLGDQPYIPVILTLRIPSNCRYIKVKAEDYEVLSKLYAKAKELEKKREDLGEQVYDALVALKTEKAVEKAIPEAMKYLVFPEVKAVPAPIFTDLRKIIKR